MNFLSKNKQILDIYIFKKALKRVRLIQKVISSCFAAYGIIFLARKSNNLIFSSSCFVSVCWNYGIYFSCFADDMSTSFCSDDKWQLRYFLDKISLVFVVFSHFFTVFCVFSLPFLSLSSRSIKFVLSENTFVLRVLFNFIVLLCPFFLCFRWICFFSFIFMPFIPALYYYFCIKTTLNLLTLVSQETGDKTKKTQLHCGVIMHTQ